MYPPVGFHFRVKFTLDHTTNLDSRFQEVSGLTSEIGTEEINEGGENRFTHRVPTRAKFPNLILRRGLAKESRLIKWFDDAVDRLVIEPAVVLVSLLDEKHDPLVSWKIIGAYPVRWAISDFKAQENALVIETVELSYKYFRRT